jgi:hypothetical protein
MAVKALKDSGIRGTFCYGFYANPSHPEVDGDRLNNFTQGLRQADAARVRKQHFPEIDPTTTLLTFGVAPNEPQAHPIEAFMKEIEFSRSIGAHIITAHVAMGHYDDGRQVV